MVMRTYSMVVPSEIIPFCEEMGELWGWCERCLYKDLKRGHSVTFLKKEYQVKYGINARQFNSIYFNLSGKIKSVRECRKREKEKLKSRIMGLEKSLKKLSSKIDQKRKDKRVKKVSCSCRIKAKKKSYANQIRFSIHNKKRKLSKLKRKLETLKSEPEKIIFGGRKLWLKQYNLSENGYDNHEEWLNDWRQARSNNFVLVGSKDEKCGNQNCQLDDQGNLNIRVPLKLRSEFGQYRSIKLPNFRYGQKEIEYAQKKGLARTYRFSKKKGKWYVHVSFDLPSPPTQSNRKNGVLGIDLNPNVIGWAVCNQEGNLMEFGQIRINVRDKKKNQTLSILGDAVSELVKIAQKYQCPISLEKLDFTKKKTTMKEMGVKYSRMLSNFAYNKFAAILVSSAQKNAIEVISVNPAYSSLMGLTKFMKRYGLSSDTAAALVLARRALWLSERPPADYARLVQADTNRHVWSFWGKLSKKLRGVSRHSFFGDSVTNSESEVNLLNELSDNELSDNRFKGKRHRTSDNRRDSGSRIAGNAVRPAS
jgi:IS605 OrfB family transposase